MATVDVPVDRGATGKGDSCRRGMDVSSLGLDFGGDIESLLSPSMNPLYTEAGPPQAVRAGRGQAGQVG